MIILCGILAITFMFTGHVCKGKRWKQFIDVYEDVEEDRLLNALAYGHVLNIILPFRIGDILRVYLSGRKLKNGYSLAFATVVVDLYLDALTVGFLFSLFRFTGFGSGELIKIANVYAILMLVLVALTIMCFRYSKYLKIIIAKVSSIFNSKIEFGLLYLSWSVISSLKSISKKINKRDLLFRTMGMWGSYLLSYTLFSKLVTLSGMKISFSEVFRILFSKNCATLFIENVLQQTQFPVAYLPFYLAIYMMLPLLAILGYIRIKKIFVKNKILTDEKKYKYLLPQLNENDKLAFLETYFSNNSDKENLDLYLHINQNINIIRDYSAGSNASTILCVDNKRTFYRKYTFGIDAVKLQNQIEWIEDHERILPLPRILSKDIGENYCCYDMEFNAKAIGFFQFMHTVPSERSWNILEDVLETLACKLYASNPRKMKIDETMNYITQKVSANLELIRESKYLNVLYGYDAIIINGRTYRNLKQYEDKLSLVNLLEIFEEDVHTNIHGDLTIENIVCIQEDSPSFYLIDPNTGNMHSSPFLDYSKLLQSLHGGYEFLLSTQKVEVDGNRIDFLDTESAAYQELYRHYHSYLHNRFSENEVRSIYYHEIIHFIRLLPYKIRKNGKRSTIFYAKLVMILDDIDHMFQ